MRKFYLSVVVSVIFMLIHGVSVAGEGSPITVYKAIEGITIALSESYTSAPIELNDIEGYFSVQLTVTGNGTMKLEYLLSNDGVTFIEPTSASDITSGHTVASGPGSDGKDFFSFSPEMARFIQIKATETGGANSVTVTARLAIQ